MNINIQYFYQLCIYIHQIHIHALSICANTLNLIQYLFQKKQNKHIYVFVLYMLYLTYEHTHPKCMYTFMCKYAQYNRIYIYIYIYTYLHVYIYILWPTIWVKTMRAGVCVYIYTHTYLDMHMCIHTYNIYIYASGICVHIYVRIQYYTHMYIQGATIISTSIMYIYLYILDTCVHIHVKYKMVFISNTIYIR